MEYRTVFDVASAGYKSWDFPAHGLIFVVVGAFLVAKRETLPGRWGRSPKARSVFAFFFFGFAIFWTLVSFISTYGEYSSLARASRTKQVQVVEGVVRSFKPMPYAGHAMERVCVESACFEYSDFIVSGGFNNTSSHGGPIREGLRVRVSFVGNSIVKLEVAK